MAPAVGAKKVRNLLGLCGKIYNGGQKEVRNEVREGKTPNLPIRIGQACLDGLPDQASELILHNAHVDANGGFRMKITR